MFINKREIIDYELVLIDKWFSEKMCVPNTYNF